MRVRCARFDELDAPTLYALLRLRSDVFVVEQGCAYADPDGRDAEPATVHCWVEHDGEVLACLRLLQEPDGSHRIGRVATRPSARGRGLARRLVRHALELPGGPVVLDAQSYLVEFYRELGFVPSGEEFLEDGIPHVRMVLSAREAGGGSVAAC